MQFLLSLCSQDLLDALGITVNTLPPFIYRMRELGYPPGWLKEAEMENSGLILYDGKFGILLWPVLATNEGFVAADHRTARPSPFISVIKEG